MPNDTRHNNFDISLYLMMIVLAAADEGTGRN